MKRILVVAAHADDEALGCGGTIAAEAEKGSDVTVMFLTNGVGARNVEPSDPAIARRAEASRRSGNILGVKGIVQQNFPDNRLDSVPLLDVVKSIESVVAEFQPSVILTHFSGDLNVDHRICHTAVVTATRPQPGHCVSTILAFEVASSTEWAFSPAGFAANYFVDISRQLEKKLKALDAYHEEMRANPHPRSAGSIEALARWRGSTVGCAAAEAFSVVRAIAKEI